jgi:hypothetical protein
LPDLDSKYRPQLELEDGEKLKLMLMRGEGRVLGRLGWGAQRQGLEALADWFRRIDPS